MAGNQPIISARDVVVGFNGTRVLNHVDLDVFRGEILGFVGGSGAGKSVLMRTIIGLIPKQEGSIEVFGTDLAAVSEEAAAQSGAAVGRAVSAGRFVFLTHCFAERPVSDAGIPQTVAAPHE